MLVFFRCSCAFVRATRSLVDEWATRGLSATIARTRVVSSVEMRKVVYCRYEMEKQRKPEFYAAACMSCRL